MTEKKYWINTQVRSYYMNKIHKYIGKEFQNTTLFVNAAVKEKLERLEERL